MRRWQTLQGAYYLLSGAWPLLHFRSFQAVTGPKPDRFQTQATAALFTATGLALLAADPAARATRLLAGGTAAATLGIELAYRRRIRHVFLLDATLEAAFLCRALNPRRARRKPHPVPSCQPAD